MHTLDWLSLIVIVFCLLDQTRWQPWVYQYGFLLAALALFSWDSDDIKGREQALNVARLIVATTYIFSGFQKLSISSTMTFPGSLSLSPTFSPPPAAIYTRWESAPPSSKSVSALACSPGNIGGFR